MTATASPWAGAHLRTTLGIFALTFLFAFESLAVSTVMPDIAADLHGLSLYAVGFAAPMAASVVALAVAGPWIDARGTRTPIAVGVAVFVAGLLLAGLAPSMTVFLLGRVVHGLGAGVVGVAQYVVVAQAYPEALRGRVFGILSAAWVLPAVVGPLLAAQVAELAGWRWVFLGATVIAVLAWLLVRDAPSVAAGGDGAGSRPGWACAAAAGVLLVSAAGQQQLPGWPLLLALATLLVLVAGVRLLPAGSWSGGRGLPSVIGTRGLMGAAYLGGEVYVPLLLHVDRGLSLGLAGLTLTAGALTWSVGSWLAARIDSYVGPALRVRAGLVVVVASVAGFALTAPTGVPLAWPVAFWALGGLGIGLGFATLAVLTLASSPEGEQGRSSAALQLNDALVLALALALGSAVFAGFAESEPVTGCVTVLLSAAVLGLVGLLPATRLAPARATT